MLIESVKRWSIIVLLIVIALLALVIMAMRVDAAAQQSKASSLEQANQLLIDVAKANADQVRAMAADAKATDLLVTSQQKAKATAREQTRSNTYVIHKALSTEACATVRLPDRAIGMLGPSGSDKDRDPLRNSTRIPDT